MFGYIVRRLAVAVPTILILIFLSFALMFVAPGGWFNAERPLPPQVLANISAKYGLDQLYWKQITTYVWNIVAHFDFGPSFKYKDRSVAEIISSGFPVTLTYGFWSFLIAGIVGVSLGVVAAIWKNTWIDYFAIGISVGAQALPNFVPAPMLVLLFTLWLGWLPGRGLERRPMAVSGDAGHCPVDILYGVDRPDHAVVDTRSDECRVHLHRPGQGRADAPDHLETRLEAGDAAGPVLSRAGLCADGHRVGGGRWLFLDRGIGLYFVNSAFNRDYSVMMGITILVGVLTIVFNLIVDVLYAWIDPKIRY